MFQYQTSYLNNFMPYAIWHLSSEKKIWVENGGIVVGGEWGYMDMMWDF